MSECIRAMGMAEEHKEDHLTEKDPQTIRVRGGDPSSDDPARRPTKPDGLARSILHVLKEYDYVKVLSVGPKALNTTMSAYRLAKNQATSVLDGHVLVCTQSEYVAYVGGKPTKGVCTRVFPIPIKHAL